jgi:hypothetical protein
MLQGVCRGNPRGRHKIGSLWRCEPHQSNWNQQLSDYITHILCLAAVEIWVHFRDYNCWNSIAESRFYFLVGFSIRSTVTHRVFHNVNSSGFTIYNTRGTNNISVYTRHFIKQTTDIKPMNAYISGERWSSCSTLSLNSRLQEGRMCFIYWSSCIVTGAGRQRIQVTHAKPFLT